jgi:hypothetical protein
MRGRLTGIPAAVTNLVNDYKARFKRNVIVGQSAMGSVKRVKVIMQARQSVDAVSIDTKLTKTGGLP